MLVEKVLVVPAEHLPATQASVIFAYATGTHLTDEPVRATSAPPASDPAEPPRCILQVNGHVQVVSLRPNTSAYTAVPVPADLVRPGRNEIRIRPFGLSRVGVRVDGRFRFGRSRWRDREKNWHTRYLYGEVQTRRPNEHMLTGEYVIRLTLRRP